MATTRLDLLQGTLDLLILRTLAAGPMHGWAISQRIQQISRDVLQVNQGSLYPALHRLEAAGWIVRESSSEDRRKKLLRPTPRVEPIWARVLERGLAVRARLARGFSPEVVRDMIATLEAMQQNLASREEKPLF